MNAALAGSGRHGHGPEDRREALATGEYKPVTGVRVSIKDCDERTPEERRQDNADAAERLGVSRMFFI